MPCEFCVSPWVPEFEAKPSARNTARRSEPSTPTSLIVGARPRGEAERSEHRVWKSTPHATRSDGGAPRRHRAPGQVDGLTVTCSLDLDTRPRYSTSILDLETPPRHTMSTPGLHPRPSHTAHTQNPGARPRGKAERSEHGAPESTLNSNLIDRGCPTSRQSRAVGTRRVGVDPQLQPH